MQQQLDYVLRTVEERGVRFVRLWFTDVLAVPDPSTFEIVPWRGEDAPVARMFCDIKHLLEEPFEGDPRYVLKRNLERARDKGFTFYTAPEMEFFIFESAHTPPVPLDTAGFFDLTQLDMVSDL